MSLYKALEVVARYADDDAPKDNNRLFIPRIGIVVEPPSPDRSQYHILDHTTRGIHRWHEATIIRSFPSLDAAKVCLDKAHVLDDAFRDAGMRMARLSFDNRGTAISTMSAAMQLQIDTMFGRQS